MGGMRLMRGCIDTGRTSDSSTSVLRPRPVGGDGSSCGSSLSADKASWDMERK